ncbi:MAG: hypothetical protein EGQ00_02035 [Parabacteroides johnsonii]|nr:hypothetical protein [Parabacteroides johnsonii]
MKSKNYIWSILLIWASCSQPDKETSILVGSCPNIFPDYVGVTIPYNIAPLNFSTVAPEEDIKVASFETEGLRFEVKANKGFIDIPIKKWKTLLEKSKGDSIAVQITSSKQGQSYSYHPFYIYVSQHPVDRYIAYRLIEPLYALWNEMGLYQRDLESFKETPIYENKLTAHNCVNCHSFCSHSAGKMLFHMRGEYNGTVLIDGNNIEFIDFKAQSGQNMVYPSWHPSGRFIAFSTNDTYQGLHPSQRIEVYDRSSDIVICDLKTRKILSPSILSSPNYLETFPSFSPDGTTLYYCSASTQTVPDSISKLRYSLCSISFDLDNGSLGQTDTLYNADIQGGSISFPRISPDGNFLMYTQSQYATFPIWHNDADLHQIDLRNNQQISLSEINSEKSESYHSWSSNSHWVVFSSRRIDGLHTRLYITHIDKKGKASKPFLLPQKKKDFYKLSMKSYNIPEFVKDRIPIHQAAQIAQKAKEHK